MFAAQEEDALATLATQAGQVTLNKGYEQRQQPGGSGALADAMSSSGLDIGPECGFPSDDPRRRPNWFRDQSTIENNGAIIRLITHNCVDQATMLKSMTLPKMEQKHLLNFIEDNFSAIKQRAIFALERHLYDGQCSVGVGETLTMEDYSFSMMVQVAHGKFHPTGRNEADLGILDRPHLLDTFCTAYDVNNTTENNVMLNGYIHLLEAPRRRVVAIRKLQERQRAQQDAQHQQQQQHQGQQPPPLQPQHAQATARPVYAINPVGGGKIKKKKKKAGPSYAYATDPYRVKQSAPQINNQQQFPNLPPGQPAVWPKRGIIPLKPVCV